MSLNDLRQRLATVPPGQLAKSAITEVESLLITCWDGLNGSAAEGTTPDKLRGRIESPKWDPPNLMFTIERHGGPVQGSTCQPARNPDHLSACKSDQGLKAFSSGS
jgi:hypothetical protein